MSTVAGTAFAVVGEDGILLDTGILQKVAKGFQARLMAMLRAPAGEVIEAIIAYQESDARLVELPQAAIRSSNENWVKVRGPAVDVSQYAKRPEPLVLRVMARTNGGTGEIVMPTIVVEST